ncbi:site-specific integrase [Clostridium beijerinckii]|uniref:site-specific integrase n=1 Tax=Clostridium beijerinckii TaxID=1520 RepID=UPI002225D5E7|nr:site-specific integrase [Clostridium beijerinckii]UYZ34986.1 site-specific integrase [Clostridium beijerinckii]
MASYKQLSKYNWKVDIPLGYENGKRQRVIKQGFKTKKDAEKFATETLAQKNRGYIASTESNILFKDFINKWFNEYKINTISTNTITNYRSRIDTHIIPKLGHHKLNKITNMIVQDFYNSLINEGAKASSAKKIMETLNNCLKYAQKNKLIYNLPTDIERVKTEKPKVEFWSKDEIDFFLNEVKDTYLYTPILIELFTGLRIGELCGLRWCDINFKTKYLTVTHQVIYDRTTKKLIFTDKLKTPTSHRKMSLPEILIDHLQSIKGEALKTDFVILSREGSMCNPRNLSMNFTGEISKYKGSLNDKMKSQPNKDLGNYRSLKQITFHALRHTHATLLIFNGENIKVVSERLGHKSISETLDTYTHVMDDMRDNTAALLDNIFKYKPLNDDNK